MPTPTGSQTVQQATEQRAEQFRDALGPFVVAAETTRMPMVFTDADGAGNPLVFVNDSFVALTGFARDAIMGQDLLSLLGDVADSGTLSLIEAALGTGTDGTWELQCRRADGVEFLAAVYLSPVRDQQGAIRQNFLSLVELGGHIDRMLKQRNEFHALYEQAPGFIAASEGPDHVFTFANASYKRLVGHDDLVGRTVADALPEIVDQGFIARLDQVFETGEPFLGTGVPIRFGAADGGTSAPRYINFVYQPIRNARDRITGLFCEGYDVTLEREAADELAALQADLIHVSRVNAMGAMATTLAHELNQPLAAISSYVAGCQRLIDPAAANADKLREALAATEEASQRAGDIIHYLRDLTRRGTPTNTSFDLRAAIGECVRLVSAGRSEALDIVNDTLDDVTMIADRVQIQQVVINLLCNAAEATIAADRDRMTIGAEITADHVIVSVTDTGGGVSAEAAKGIFSWSDSNKAGGMGLGLSISRTIVEGHDGRIWLERSDRTGSTFCFSLPRGRMIPIADLEMQDG
ncbi:PAS domain-containing sensor histidine kinase [Sphingomonas oligophenolica]|nr:PAS domain-containing sensor histidine kinase [Sphingomonas oligophenolica]